MEFKVGDKVRAKKGNSHGYTVTTDNSVNEVIEVISGRIIKVKTLESDFECFNPDSNNIFRVRVEYMELIEPAKTEIKVNYILLSGSVTLSFDGQMVSIKKGDHRYAAIIEAIRDDKLELIPDLVDVAKSFSMIDNVELVDGRIKLNGKHIPETVSNRVLQFKEQGLPFDPLMKFAEKLMKNPSFSSRKMLYKFLERNEHPITKDGNFIAYKKVNRDFKDCYTGKMDNSIGTIVEMDRSEVDDDPAHYCSSGLHVAAYNYASNFSNGHLVEVEIDPEDVVAVPNDYDGEKMRVCKYKVVALCESRLEDVALYDNDDDDYYDEREDY